jgi:hypothetical protein
MRVRDLLASGRESHMMPDQHASKELARIAMAMDL